MDRAPSTPASSGADAAREPGRRALEAMANASRRAQGSGPAASGEVPPTDRDEETGARRLVSRSSGSAGGLRSPGATVDHRGDGAAPASLAWPAPRTDWRSRWRLDSRRRRAVVLAGAAGVLVVAGAGVALGIALRSPSRPPTGRPGRGTASNLHGASATSGTGGNHPAAASPTTAAPAPQPSPAGAPRLSSASPASGSSGQTVLVEGSALFSSDGEVVAYFGGSQAPTSCTSQTACRVIVPDLASGPSKVPLTVVTSSGRSNALTFSYS